ncbi:MAG: VacJ family lipoprotein [Alphaproteobacteria bacterium]|nr:VacJ family lipoprotein [Alphaproteobacteria bacterium]
MSIRRLLLTLALLTLPAMLPAFAELPKSPEAQAEAIEVNDPLEPVNRAVFDVNDFLDRLLIKPLTELYRFAIPDYLRERIANILSNMGEPVIFANNLLQGETSRAAVTAQRFVVNTTVGLAGMYEVAEDLDLARQPGDFGQTLYSWGLGSGPYIVLPLFGPSNIRDAIGLGVDMVMSPWQWIAARGGRAVKNEVVYTSFAANGLTRREENLEAYDALRTGALDFYAQMRSIYRQYRNRQLGIQPEDTSRLFDFME